MKHTLFILFSAMCLIAGAQTGTFDHLRSKTTFQPPRYGSMAAANAAGQRAGNLIFVHSGADSGLYVRSLDNSRWITISGFQIGSQGSSSSGWSLLGNANIDTSINFIGTTTNQDLRFRRNNTRAGTIGTSIVSLGVNTPIRSTNILTSRSVYIGNDAGTFNVSGLQNVIVGHNAGRTVENNFSGAVIIGAFAGNSNIHNSVSIGNESSQGMLLNQSTSAFQTSVGFQVNGTNYNIGSQNSRLVLRTISIGARTGSSNTNVFDNIYVGNKTGSISTNHFNNIIIGNDLTLSDGTKNTVNIGGAIFATGIHQPDTTGTGYIVSNVICNSSASINSKVGIGIANPTAVLDLRASTNLEAVLRLRVGPAPTSPNDGELWLESNTVNGLKIRIDGVTRTVQLN